MFLKTCITFSEGGKRVLNVFDMEIFPIKIEGTGFSDKVSDTSNLKI